AGHVLTTGDDSARRLSDVLRLQREIESGLAARVQGLIEHALGPGTATVTVSADVDFDRRELRTESFDPEEPVLRSENMLAPPRAGTDAPPAYVQESPATTLAPGDGGSPPYRQAESREFEISNTSEVRVSTGGGIRRLSVAVLVDENAVLETAGNRTLETVIRSIGDVARRAVGFRSDRGDEVVVEAMPFALPEPPSAPVESGNSPELNWPWSIFAPVIVFFFLLLGAAVVIRLARARSTTRVQSIGSRQRIRDLETVIERRSLNRGNSHGVDEDDSPGPDPERALAVVKSWLSEGREVSR
ncbi:MAG: flagellar M-ring protein FliF C-terminal domain-containing protein, partial [Myxococcota bacterium]